MSITAQIDGEFSGFDDGAIFRLSNGQTWQQSRYQYRYFYAYRPRVEIARVGPSYIMKVPSMQAEVAVVPVTVLCEGAIISEFSGFTGDSIFEFDNGQRWAQSEYKYSYHYAYRPVAVVVDGVNGVAMSVEGMDESVGVRRIR